MLATQSVQEKFDLWCVVELFGHAKIAGRCTEQNIAGTNMLRVDVPETDHQPAFTRFFGSSAIYAINPVDEQTAKYYAERLEQKPIESYDVKRMLEKNDKLRLALSVGENKGENWRPVNSEYPENGAYTEDQREPDEEDLACRPY